MLGQTDKEYYQRCSPRAIMNGRSIALVLGVVGLLVTLGACARSGVRGCTVVTVSQAEEVFFGCNDDYHNRDSTYWVDPGGPGQYGAIYFGNPTNVQQGFNEMGLAYDANGLPRAWVTDHPGTIPVAGSYTAYPIAILRECATVAEVVSWVRTHQWHDYMHDQCHFADATILLLAIAPVAVALLLVHAPILAFSRSSRYLRAVVCDSEGTTC